MRDKEIEVPQNEPLSEEELLKAAGGFGTLYYRWACYECDACRGWNRSSDSTDAEATAHEVATGHAAGVYMKLVGAGPD